MIKSLKCIIYNVNEKSIMLKKLYLLNFHEIKGLRIQKKKNVKGSVWEPGPP